MNESIIKLSLKGVKVHVVTDYAETKEQLLKINTLFSSNEQIIHSARNVIKKGMLNDLNIIIKSFKVPGPWGRFIYTFFRKSKARRSFEYSLRLNANKINSPSPIAFIEFYNFGLLKSSFYISEEFRYDGTLHDVLRRNIFSYEEIFPEVARFAFNMHQKGFLHLDFSPGNILVKKIDEGYLLSMVDVNRMRFGYVDFDLGLKSFTRLLRNQDSVNILARAYADCAKKNQEETVEKLNNFYQEFIKSTKLIHRIKAPLKKLAGRS